MEQASSERPDDGQTDDINVLVPVWTIVPLAVAFVAAFAWAFGMNRLLVSLVPFGVLLAAVTVIDLRELRIPDKLTYPGVVLGIPLLLVASTADWIDLSFGRALLGGLAMFAIYFVLAALWPSAMGFGDVKLALVLGAQLGLFGWVVVARGVLSAHLLMGPVALVLLLRGRARMKTHLPFGPFLVLGTIVALVLEGLAR